MLLRRLSLQSDFILRDIEQKVKECSSGTRGKFLYVDSSKKTQQVESTESTTCHQYSSRNNVKDSESQTGSTKLEKTKKRTCEGEIGSKKFEEVGKNHLKFTLKIKIKASKEPCKLEDLKALYQCNDASCDKVHTILLEALHKVVSEVDGKTKEQVMTRDLIGIRVSIKIEMFKNMGLYNEVEKLKYGSIMFNIKYPTNPNL